MNFTDSQLTIWGLNYEAEIVSKYDLVADRWSPAIISGVSEYEIPNYVTNIRSVLWQGKELHPKGFTASRMTQDTPFQTAGSVPFEYLFSGKGQRVLKFLPTPQLAIAEYTGDLWTVAADNAGVIIEFYRTPKGYDPLFQLPNWCRRRLLKNYICWKGFSIEGPTQDLRAANYYQNQLDLDEDYLKLIKEKVREYRITVLSDIKNSGRTAPGRPILPPNFGYPVY